MTVRNAFRGDSPDSHGHAALTGLRRRHNWELHPGVRSGRRLSMYERAADAARDVVGSWKFAVGAGVLMTVSIVVGVRHDSRAGPATVIGLILSGVALVELSLVLMTSARADRTAAELALYQLDCDRRAAAGVDEVRDEVEQVRRDLARLTARVEASSKLARLGGPTR